VPVRENPVRRWFWPDATDVEKIEVGSRQAFDGWAGVAARRARRGHRRPGRGRAPTVRGTPGPAL